MGAKENVERLLAKADVKINGSRPWDIQVHNEKWYSRLMAGGRLALGESYMDGDWDVERMDEMFFRVLSADLARQVLGPSFVLSIIKSKLTNRQTKKRSKDVATQHYDLSNEFYEKMLGKTMAYTCAYWKNTKNLDKAQEQKLDLVCQKVGIKKGDRVLDLGSGWGSFAYHAAKKYKCHVTSVNISKEQVAYAKKKCKGLPVQVLQMDYRDVTGEYDKVVAIGIAEHVGYKNYRTLMEVGHRSLKKHGLFLLHTIAGNVSTTMCDPWFDKYIFPHGMLPSIKQLGEAMEGLFVMEDWHNFGSDYDKTLMAWHHNFEKSWPQFKGQFDERFYRMWTYYLVSLAGSFRARYIQLWQIVLAKGGVPGGYTAVR